MSMSSYTYVERIADLTDQLAAERDRADRTAAFLRSDEFYDPTEVLAEHDADRARWKATPGRLEFGWILSDGSYLCDGCSTRNPFEHRCHRGDGDGQTCGCEQCKPGSPEQLAAFRAENGLDA